MKFEGKKNCGLLSNNGDVAVKIIRSIHHSQKVVLAQGFGVQDKDMPVRILAYIVPVLNILKQMPATATAEFYLAVEGVLRANRELDRNKVWNNALITKDLIRSYVANIHPQLIGQIKILLDRSIDENSLLNRVIMSLTNQSYEVYRDDQVIRNFADKRGGYHALRYMVEHMFYMRDPIAIDGGNFKDFFLVPEMNDSMDHVIMIGWPAEKIFYRFRQKLLSLLDTHSEWYAHQMFTTVGDTPTYHAQKGEPLWQELPAISEDVNEMIYGTYHKVTNEYGINKSIINDLLILLADAAGHVDFSQIANQQKNILKKEISDETAKILQRGWDRIRNI